MASNDVFGDPCVETFKYLQVYYTCQPIGENFSIYTQWMYKWKSFEWQAILLLSPVFTRFMRCLWNVCYLVYTLPPLITTKVPTTTTEVTTATTKATTTDPPQRRVCDAIYFEGRNWPYTKVGEVASMSCTPPRVGRITWRCTGNGWKGERPDDSNCQLTVTGNLILLM